MIKAIGNRQFQMIGTTRLNSGTRCEYLGKSGISNGCTGRIVDIQIGKWSAGPHRCTITQCPTRINNTIINTIDGHRNVGTRHQGNIQWGRIPGATNKKSEYIVVIRTIVIGIFFRTKNVFKKHRVSVTYKIEFQNTSIVGSNTRQYRQIGIP